MTAATPTPGYFHREWSTPARCESDCRCHGKAEK